MPRSNNPLAELAVTAVGGAAGALAAGLLARSGLQPPMAAAAVAAAGGVAAAFTRGNVRLLAVGAAAAGVGQLVFALVRGGDDEVAADDAATAAREPTAPARNGDVDTPEPAADGGASLVAIDDAAVACDGLDHLMQKARAELANTDRAGADADALRGDASQARPRSHVPRASAKAHRAALRRRRRRRAVTSTVTQTHSPRDVAAIRCLSGGTVDA